MTSETRVDAATGPPAAPAADGGRDPRVTVVIVALNGRRRLVRSLPHTLSLPERPPVIVVDNGSTDGTAEMLRERFPAVRCIPAGANLAAAGRNLGVAATTTPYVAFAEDDSWYEPGALPRAADVLDAHGRIGLVNAHVLVGEDRRSDPLHEDMVATPVPDDPSLPGHRILSFLEGVSVVRRSAFEEVGGFDPRLALGGPEEHLAADLLAAGWELRYLPEVTARHVPDHGEPSPLVRRLGLRNTLWFAWTRRPLIPAVRWTLHVTRQSPATRATLGGVLDALRGLPWALRHRRPLPPAIEAHMALLDAPKRASRARRYGAPRRRRWARPCPPPARSRPRG